jgi:hypothetical protein
MGLLTTASRVEQGQGYRRGMDILRQNTPERHEMFNIFEIEALETVQRLQPLGAGRGRA